MENFCSQTGLSFENALGMLLYHEADIPGKLASYMAEHPEITAIEYDGELRTEEELNKIKWDNMAALYSETETDAFIEPEADTFIEPETDTYMEPETEE